MVMLPHKYLACGQHLLVARQLRQPCKYESPVSHEGCLHLTTVNMLLHELVIMINWLTVIMSATSKQSLRSWSMNGGNGRNAIAVIVTRT